MKLTAYFGERDRIDGGFLADALTEIYERHALKVSLILRGIEGFGHHRHLRTDRLLTLSEDLPIVSVAVDGRERIEAARAEVERLDFDGLVTLERARLLTADPGEVELGEPVKLTAYVGRQARVGGRPAHLAIVDLLHRHGVAGATVLLGVDGTAHGVRERARFFARNAEVPLMIIAVGEGGPIAAAVPELTAMLGRPLLTLERVVICRRDGQEFGTPDPPGEGNAWRKLMVHGAGAQHERLVHDLRAAGAAGATTLRGIWGYHGDHAPHGDRFWQTRRRVPVLSVIVDTPERSARWLEIVGEHTSDRGLVTSELVPIR